MTRLQSASLATMHLENIALKRIMCNFRMKGPFLPPKVAFSAQFRDLPGNWIMFVRNYLEMASILPSIIHYSINAAIICHETQIQLSIQTNILVALMIISFKLPLQFCHAFFRG